MSLPDTTDTLSLAVCAGGWDGARWHRLEVLHAPSRTAFSRQLLESADHDYLTVTGDLIRLQADNGVWVYRITGFDPVRDCYYAKWV